MNAIDATSARVDVGLNMSERDRLDAEGGADVDLCKPTGKDQSIIDAGPLTKRTQRRIATQRSDMRRTADNYSCLRSNCPTDAM